MATDYVMAPYDDALREILETGSWRTNKRTGIRTKSVFGMSRRYNLSSGLFPLVTRRKIYPMSIFKELLWVISGSTNNKDLKEVGCNIWTPWEDREFEKKNGFVEGALGPIYGFQLRHFNGEYGDGSSEFWLPDDTPFASSKYEKDKYGVGGFDQLAYMVKRIKKDPSCRRILFSLWNPQQIGLMKLPPCHLLFQVCIDDDKRATGILYQRSGDYPVGCCANVQFYTTLLMMICQQGDCVPHELVHVVGDAHIYEDQIGGVEEYLATPVLPSPRMNLRKAVDIDSYTIDSFELVDFVSGPKIKIPVAV